MDPNEVAVEMEDVDDELTGRTASDATSTTWSFIRGIGMVVAAIVLVPGALFGFLFLVFTPINMIEGRGTWLAVYPLSYALSQALFLSAWFRASRASGLRRLIFWSAATVICSIFLIAEMQRQISRFEGLCGNILLGPFFMQLAACGTIFGVFFLSVERRHSIARHNF